MKRSYLPIAGRSYGKRGQLAKSAVRNLWDRFKKYEAAIVLLFARVPDVVFSIIVLNGI